MMINPVMPIVFWLAALDAGKLTGVWATVLGGLAHMIMGKCRSWNCFRNTNRTNNRWKWI